MRRIAVMNQKGGVGKTTTTLSLAHALALSGRRVTALDMDPQGHLGKGLGLNGEAEQGLDEVLLDGVPLEDNVLEVRERLRLVPAGERLAEVEMVAQGGASRGFRLNEALQGKMDNEDFIFIDCPPSAGLLSMNALFAAEEVVVPVSSDYLALHGVSRFMMILQHIEQALNRQMKVIHQLGQLGIGFNQARAKLFGVRGGKADSFNARHFRDVLKQQSKIGNLACIAHFPAVGIHVLPKQIDFSHALVGKIGNFSQHIFKRAGNFFTARVGNHAETTILAAAFHNGHKCSSTGVFGQGQIVELLDFGKRNVHLRSVCIPALLDQLWQSVQGLRTKHHIDIRRTLNNGLAFLAGHTAAHTNNQVGVGFFQVLDTPQIAEHLFLRFFTHRTGIEQNDICIIWGVRSLQAV